MLPRDIFSQIEQVIETLIYIDIDECNIMHGVCGENGECQNIPGSFECRCKEGYESHPMLRVCTGRSLTAPFSRQYSKLIALALDINECERTPGLCRGGNCTNDIGSYHCECPEGHELSADKQSCKGKSKREVSLRKSPVTSNSDFIYGLDIDECSRTSGICSNGVCENMMGTYQCVCDTGYQQTDQKSHCEGMKSFFF